MRLAPLEGFKVISLIVGVCSVQSNQEVAHKSVTATGLPAFAQNSSNPGKNIKYVDSGKDPKNRVMESVYC